MTEPNAKDLLRYDRILDQALRSVLRTVLLRVAKDGLPGAHHLFISFTTTHPGVEMANHMRQRHPDTMTIVLQHQYWGLEVTEDAFAVTLSFAKLNERLRVPFAALVAFSDPSVKFGLQFTQPDQPAPERPPPPPSGGGEPKPKAGAPSAGVVALDTFRKGKR
ncbi:MAG: hypothetical protein EXQ96_00980 [Alphaproteobacteria bacterium]|nr:hypothetical protein [Alphaproteobacteria bacterium]